MNDTAKTELIINSGQSDAVQRMRDARNSPAVHKMTLATIRAHNSQCMVFVCEGVDDKKVYFHWLRIISPLLNYEFQVCNGKGKLLAFREMLKRDISGLDKNVYFFIDRDFDGLQGHPSGSDIYISDSYSFENFLVNKEVLNNLLCVELHCHGEHLVREDVLSRFDDIYTAFLDVTRPYNERIFLARKIGIQIKPLPTRLGKLAEVTLAGVTPQQEGASSVINLEREPNQEEVNRYKSEFDTLEPKLCYRGKFALLFFLRWVNLLAEDRNAENSVLFSKAHKSAANANGQISLDSVAAKSLPPPLFRKFIESITDAKKSGCLAGPALSALA